MSTLSEATRPLTRAQRRQLRPAQFDLHRHGEPTPLSGRSDNAPPDQPADSLSRSVRLKCPLPLIQAEPDALRQYYGSERPLSRVVVPTGLL